MKWAERDSGLELSSPCPGLQVQRFLWLAQRGTEEKEREEALASLRRGLQHQETQQTFIRSVPVWGGDGWGLRGTGQ